MMGAGRNDLRFEREVCTMDKEQEGKLSDDMLDEISGGIEDQIESRESVEDGTCPTCGGTAYRITEKGYLGPFRIEKTHRECPVHGWLSV